MSCLHLDYNSSAVGHICAMSKVTLVQGHMSIIRNICLSVFLVTLLIVLGPYKIHTDIVVSYVHINLAACVAYVWHLRAC